MSKQVKPQEQCPVCGGKFMYYIVSQQWYCDIGDHNIEGPTGDPDGCGIDRMIRKIRHRIIKEHEMRGQGACK